MMFKRISLLVCCAGVSLMAYVVLDFWETRNAPLYKKFERQWADDIVALEASPKLPKPWFDVSEVEITGGTPEAKSWLRQIEVPTLKKKDDGKHKLEVLVVPWLEEGKNGVMVQYNLVDLKSKNMVFELGRTLILADKNAKDPIKTFWKDFSL